MLKELKLSNFRIFDDEVTVRFRPITLFIGKNNAGKSSVVKFLLMLQQSVINPDLDDFFVTSGGEKYNFNPFDSLKNEGSEKTSLDFSLEFGEDSSPRDSVHSYLGAAYSHGGQDKISYKIEAIVNYYKASQLVGKEQKLSFAFKQNDEDGEDIKYLSHTARIVPNSTFLDLSLNDRDLEEDVDDSGLLLEHKIKQSCVEKIKNDLEKLQYISAMRNLIKGTFDTDAKLNKFVAMKGEDCIIHLWKKHLLDNESKKDLLFENMKRVLEIGNMRFTQKDNLVSCLAQNMATGKEVNIANFGFGVDQCLPIFVQGLITPPKTHLIVEQPEAQVHPTAQIEMGSFFADLWQKRGVGSVIETHSDNLLLRLRRLIAKGDLRPDDVSVALFDAEDGRQTVKNLSINEDGSMEKGLRIGFFHAAIGEALKMRAGK